jgi:F-type H+-transporting ATPase subunit epsilon
MASTVHCSIVSAELEIFSGMVEMVVASGTEGELGIFPGHTPLLSGVKPGPVRLRLEGGKEAERDLADNRADIDFGRITVDLAEQAAMLRTIRKHRERR